MLYVKRKNVSESGSSHWVAHGQIRLCLASLTNQSVPLGDHVFGDSQQRALLPAVDRGLKNPAKRRWQIKTDSKNLKKMKYNALPGLIVLWSTVQVRDDPPNKSC